MIQTLDTAHIADYIRNYADGRERCLVAIDGRCASGKTTLAAALERKLSASVIHMDHFFLRPEQRTEIRLAIPGENIDHERFLSEVLMPLANGEVVRYRPYDCQTRRLGELISITNRKIIIIEGSYSCHPALRDFYDLRLFLTVKPEEQMQRILSRNGEVKAIQFRDRWIPLEEAYFTGCHVESYCDRLIYLIQ